MIIATITSKGQITIPFEIRKRLHLKAGDKLDFDEHAPFLKAFKVTTEEDRESIGENWKDPWPDQTVNDILTELRGECELPQPNQATAAE